MGLVNSASWNTLPQPISVSGLLPKTSKDPGLSVHCSVLIVATLAFVTILVNCCVSEMTVYHYVFHL